MDTVVAISTSLTRGAVGIVKLSGELALPLARQIFVPKGAKSEFEPRKMVLGTVKAGEVCDIAMLVWFNGPHSYTGEDVVELQTHGGAAVLNAVLKKLVELGARPADNGEFTKRAFLNNKLTLDEAEGVADIVNAVSECAANHAYRLLSGELSQTIYSTTEALIRALTFTDAALDYPEEVLDDCKIEVSGILNEALRTLNVLLATAKYKSYITDGISVCIAGMPNVGKSSLLNAILGEERAIVTAIAGTTRDTLSESVELNGLRYRFTDTAGIRDSSDFIENIGVERAVRAVKGADLVLYLIDLSDGAEDSTLAKALEGKRVIRVGTKSDIARIEVDCTLKICTRNAADIKRMLDLVSAEFSEAHAAGTVLTKERHIFAVKGAAEAVASAISALDISPDRVAADIRAACASLAAISGVDVSESVVYGIFANFCVGK